jgi:hypothetical protein
MGCSSDEPNIGAVVIVTEIINTRLAEVSIGGSVASTLLERPLLLNHGELSQRPKLHATTTISAMANAIKAFLR